LSPFGETHASAAALTIARATERPPLPFEVERRPEAPIGEDGP
jgi:hypothetical protein